LGDIRKKSKTYEIQEIKEIEDLPPGWVIEINEKSWNFETLANWGDRSELAYCFSVFFWRTRHLITNDTRDKYWHSYKKFWSFLESNHIDINSIDDISLNLMLSFKSWLSVQNVSLKYRYKVSGVDKLSQGTKRHIFGAIRNTFERLIAMGLIGSGLKLPENGYTKIVLNTKKTVPYSQLERMRIVEACSEEFELIDIKTVHKHRQIYVPFILILAMRTGINVQPILDLTINSLQKSILDGRYELNLKKNRGYSSQKITLNEDGDLDKTAYVSKKIVSLIERLIEISEPLRQKAPAKYSDKIFLVTTQDDEVRSLTDHELWVNIQRFRDKYELKNDDGSPLELNVRRMRPTFAHSLLKINGGDIRHLQKSLNHKSINTTMGYLDANQEDFKSSFKFNGIIMQNTLAKSIPEILSSEIDCSIDEAEKLIAGHNQMTVSTCKNPNNSPILKGDLETSCTKFMACFRCQNQVITKEDSHKVFSFYWWLLEKKNHMPSSAWAKGYEWIIRTIDNDIYPKLGLSSDVEKIKQDARMSPYPAWKILGTGSA